MRVLHPLILGLFLSGCEQATSPREGESSRFRLTFSGVIHRMIGNDTARVQSLGIQAGDTVTYTFLVDTLGHGFSEYKEGRYPEKDSGDTPGRRPRFHFDSLESPPLNPLRPDEVVQMRYAGHRSEEASGFGGTFFTHQYSMGDSMLNVAVCFSDTAGGPLLPKVGDAVTGTEHFYYISSQETSTLQSILEVVSIVPVAGVP